ncbi:hypothetical protein CJD36_015255 [Flavipsychrobacter stenotrophus]|uniref:Outer membrane protein beta-barrel domain-containing protein n=1 Tax=Flavipsychrobacter stenotrophus TaxID=2077091 RepID=A0A2S7STI8_9BACT|nr:hypothetical protein [Flavipsychrobacter stenotrophus]PQJ10054.1 hypothetical protein CJD36_015255 [Flavipsychrobacter stenotrophus]
MIKLSSLILVACLSATTAQKHTWIVELEGDYDRQAYTKGSYDPTQYLESWLISAAGGYQITNHFTVGLMIGGSSTQYFVPVPIAPAPAYGNTLENAKHSRNTIDLGIWFRYTHSLNNRF